MRSTIATRLFNTKKTNDLFELHSGSAIASHWPLGLRRTSRQPSPRKALRRCRPFNETSEQSTTCGSASRSQRSNRDRALEVQRSRTRLRSARFSDQCSHRMASIRSSSYLAKAAPIARGKRQPAENRAENSAQRGELAVVDDGVEANMPAWRENIPIIAPEAREAAVQLFAAACGIAAFSVLAMALLLERGFPANSCTTCHLEKSPAWAEHAISQWAQWSTWKMR